MAKTSQHFGVSLAGNTVGAMCALRAFARKPWEASVSIPGKKHLKKRFATEREAAIQVDKWILEYRLDKPLNILKAKAA